MLPIFKALILPDAKIAFMITTILALAISVGTLTPLAENVDAPGSDKWHHFIAFTALAYPLTAAGRSYWIPTIIFGLSLGPSIEIIQPYVDRYGYIKDFQADALGMLMRFSLGFVACLFKDKFNFSL